MDLIKSSEDKDQIKLNDEKEKKRLSEEKAKLSLEEEKNWEDEYLDEEMEVIFHPSSDQFCLADLTCDQKVKGSPHFDETDYQMHRRESFQYHQPLHKMYHKHRKSSHKKRSKDSRLAMSQVPEESSPKDEPSEEDPLVTPSEDTISKKPKLVNGAQKHGDSKAQFYMGSSSSLENTADNKNKGVPLKSVLRGLLAPSDVSSEVSGCVYEPLHVGSVPTYQLPIIP